MYQSQPPLPFGLFVYRKLNGVEWSLFKNATVSIMNRNIWFWCGKKCEHLVQESYCKDQFLQAPQIDNLGKFIGNASALINMS